MQQIVVILIFFGALAYLGWIGYSYFTAKGNCATGCGKCGAIDIKKIEEQFKAKTNPVNTGK